MFSSLRARRNYRLYFGGQIVSLSGTWMADTALPWLALELSGSPFAVGVVAFCRFAPFTLFGLFAGVLADRFDVRRTLIAVQAGSIAVAATLAALVLTGAVELWHVYLLAAAGGFLVLVELPSRQAFVYELVGRGRAAERRRAEHEPPQRGADRRPGARRARDRRRRRGLVLRVQRRQLPRGARRAARDPRSTSSSGRTAPAPRLGLVDGLRDAARVAWRSPRIRTVLLLIAVLSLVGVNFRVLLPVLASSTLDADAALFGVLFACFGAGALLGSLAAAAAARSASVRVFLVGFGAYSAAMLVLAPLRSAAAAAVVLFVIGACFSVWATSGQSIVLLDAPDALRGRIGGLLLFAFLGVQPVGSLLAGWLADTGGTTLAFVVAGSVGGAATLVATAALVRAGALGPVAGAPPVVLEQPPAA